MIEWNVYLEMPSGPQFIGTVFEKTESLARCAAISLYEIDSEVDFSVSKK